MFGYLKGKVEHIFSDCIYLDVNSVGYKVLVGNPHEYIEGSNIKVFTHLNVREDDLSIFGFESNEKYNLFIKLLSVKGIGAKTAMVIVSCANPEIIFGAIEEGNTKYLCNFPGIGLKTSQQIILDLKGKLDKGVNKNHADLIESLESLGYKSKIINNILKEINFKSPLNVQIKEALKLLLNK